jgi:hypothetical protein
MALETSDYNRCMGTASIQPLTHYAAVAYWHNIQD